MIREEFRDLIRRRFGWPIVNVELEDAHIDDNIHIALQKYQRFAIGNATQENWMTLMLSGGQQFYSLPPGTTEIESVEDSGSMGGINTLFTIDNFLYNQGAFNFFAMSSGYSLVSYHITLGFLETLRRYAPSKYRYKYHKGSNTLEVNPPPDRGSVLMLTDGTSANSPGFALLKAHMLEGSTEPNWTYEEFVERMFEKDWVIDYVTALCKISLGTVRRKLENAATMVGNMNASFDGSAFMQEGLAEKEKLEEKLQDTEVYVGFSISFG